MADDYFLKIDGIDGESRDAKHKNEIEVLSWSWGESAPVGHPGGGSAAGKVQVQDFHFTTRFSKASPPLLLACASGKELKSALLTARKAGDKGIEYLTFSLSDLLVSSYQTGGTEGVEVPMDSVSLNFAKIQVEYKELKADGTLGGSVKSGWDVNQGKGF
jgi:type VI secretion system secreted protein Hcp